MSRYKLHYRPFALACIVGVAVSPSCGGGTSSSPDVGDVTVPPVNEAGGLVTASSPDATFASAKSAVVSGDWKGFYDWMTADMRDQMAGTMVLVGGLSRAASTLPSTDTSAAHQQKQLAAQIGAVFAKHGVADEAFERDVERLDFRILAQDIHDKSRFLADMRAATLNDPLRKDGLEDEIQSSTLEGVTITGEIASATMVTPKRRHPIRFQKAGGIWKIDTNMLPWGDLSPQ